MDEILLKVKEQVETSKQQALAKKPFPMKSKQKIPVSLSPKPETHKSPNKKSVGTFGTSKREVFSSKSSAADYISSAEYPKRIPGGYISTLPRKPSSRKAEAEPVQPLSPNYSILKKKPSSAVISSKPFKPKAPSPSKAEAKHYELKEELDQAFQSISTADSDFSEFFKAKENWEKELQREIALNPALNQIVFPPASFLYQREKKQLKDEDDKKTDKNDKQPAPNFYLPKHELVERAAKGVKFGKSPRLPREKPKEELPLFPNYDFVLKNPASFKYVPETEKSEKLVKKEQEEDERLALSSILYKMRDLALPESQKPRVTGGVISPFVDIPTRFNGERLGPGKYDPDYSSIEPQVLGSVAYNEPYISAHVPRFINPGPGMYYVVEDEEIPGGFIPESPRAKSPARDIRPPLDPNYFWNKAKIPSALILPEGLQKVEESDPLGPGKYTPSYKLIEKRSDIDVLPFVQEKEKPEEKDEKLPLFINDSLVRPGIPSFLYKPPAETAPPHLPDSYFVPEQWKFYDRNDDFRFGRPFEVSFAPTDYENFKDYEKDREVLSRINQKLRGNLPPVGTYDPDPVVERVPAYDFGKMTSRDPSYLQDLQDEDKEGDVLILDPQKLFKIPNLVNMEKSTGRDETQDDSEYKSELLLEPKIDLIKKRVPMLVNMQKDLGRLEKVEEEDEKLLLSPNFDVGRKKVPMLVNIEKQLPRDPETFEPDQHEDLVIVGSIQGPAKPIRSLVNMEKMTGRAEEATNEEDFVIVHLPKIPEKPAKNIQVPNFSKMTAREEVKEPDLECEVVTHQLALISPDDMYRAVEPSKKAPNFERFIGRTQEIVEDPSDIPFVYTGKF